MFVVNGTTVEIQMHDTYFVIDKVSMLVLILGPLTFLIFLVRGLIRKFKSIATNIGLVIGLMLISLITYRIIDLQESYINEVKRLDNKDLPDGFYPDMKNRINWGWNIFALCTTGIIALGIKTVKLWREVRDSRHKLPQV